MEETFVGAKKDKEVLEEFDDKEGMGELGGWSEIFFFNRSACDRRLLSTVSKIPTCSSL